MRKLTPTTVFMALLVAASFAAKLKASTLGFHTGN
jgi:hypothetical protein